MIRFALIVLFLSNSAFAGGNLTSYPRKVMLSTACILDTDCAEFSAIPNFVKSACITIKNSQKRHCVVYYGTCASGPGFTGVWNTQTKKCDLNLVMPDNGLICYSDADCGMGGGVSQFGDVLVTEAAIGCVLVPGTNWGQCESGVTDAVCCAWGMDDAGNCHPQSKYCFSNYDCIGDNKVCVDHMCRTPNLSQTVGDGNVCNNENDCGEGLGKLCVITQSTSTTGLLCQECTQFESSPGIHLGCTPERPVCRWGVGMTDPITGESRSVYWCAVH